MNATPMPSAMIAHERAIEAAVASHLAEKAASIEEAQREALLDLASLPLAVPGRNAAVRVALQSGLTVRTGLSRCWVDSRFVAPIIAAAAAMISSRVGGRLAAIRPVLVQDAKGSVFGVRLSGFTGDGSGSSVQATTLLVQSTVRATLQLMSDRDYLLEVLADSEPFFSDL